MKTFPFILRMFEITYFSEKTHWGLLEGTSHQWKSKSIKIQVKLRKNVFIDPTQFHLFHHFWVIFWDLFKVAPTHPGWQGKIHLFESFPSSTGWWLYNATRMTSSRLIFADQRTLNPTGRKTELGQVKNVLTLFSECCITSLNLTRNFKQNPLSYFALMQQWKTARLTSKEKSCQRTTGIFATWRLCYCMMHWNSYIFLFPFSF